MLQQLLAAGSKESGSAVGGNGIAASAAGGSSAGNGMVVSAVSNGTAHLLPNHQQYHYLHEDTASGSDNGMPSMLSNVNATPLPFAASSSVSGTSELVSSTFAMLSESYGTQENWEKQEISNGYSFYDTPSGMNDDYTRAVGPGLYESGMDQRYDPSIDARNRVSFGYPQPQFSVDYRRVPPIGVHPGMVFPQAPLPSHAHHTLGSHSNSQLVPVSAAPPQQVSSQMNSVQNGNNSNLSAADIARRHYMEQLAATGAIIPPIPNTESAKNGLLVSPADGLSPICPYCERFISHYKGNIRRHVNHCRVSGGKKSKGVNGSTGAVGGASNNASIGGIQQQVQTASMLPHTGKSSGGGPSAKRRKFAPAAAEEWSVAPGEMTLYEHISNGGILPPPPPSGSTTQPSCSANSAQPVPATVASSGLYEMQPSSHSAATTAASYQQQGCATAEASPSVPGQAAPKKESDVPDDPYLCPHCDFLTVYKGNMKRHLNTCHQGEEEPRLDDMRASVQGVAADELNAKLSAHKANSTRGRKPKVRRAEQASSASNGDGGGGSVIHSPGGGESSLGSTTSSTSPLSDAFGRSSQPSIVQQQQHQRSALSSYSSSPLPYASSVSLGLGSQHMVHGSQQPGVHHSSGQPLVPSPQHLLMVAPHAPALAPPQGAFYAPPSGGSSTAFQSYMPAPHAMYGMSHPHLALQPPHHIAQSMPQMATASQQQHNMQGQASMMHSALLSHGMSNNQQQQMLPPNSHALQAHHQRASAATVTTAPLPTTNQMLFAARRTEPDEKSAVEDAPKVEKDNVAPVEERKPKMEEGEESVEEGGDEEEEEEATAEKADPGTPKAAIGKQLENVAA